MRAAVVEAAESLRAEILDISRDLHDHPELSLEEHRSAGLLSAALARGGFAVASGVGGLPTSFLARLRGGAGPRVAILAEYDALPEIGHGCGHNLIAAAGVGAGLALARAAAAHRTVLPGEVLVVGTPAEETIGGKGPMVDAGVFEGVDAAMMAHGGAEWRVFTDSLACASIRVTFLGRESHAVAWPEKGVNALDALIQLFVAVEMMRKRLGGDVHIPGVILEGGVRPNIVPARAVGAFSLRAPTKTRLQEVRAEVERAVRAIAEAVGCRAGIEQTDHTYDEMITNVALARRYGEYLASMGIETVDTPRQHRGSLDMGNVSRAVPSLHAFMAVAGADTPVHTAAFAQATVTPAAGEALMITVKALALTAHDVLADPDLLQEVRREFEAARRGGDTR